MIQTDLATVISIYLFVLVIIPLIMWFFFGYGERPRFKKVSADRSLWQCSICTHVYEVGKDQSISICPKCKSYNSKEGL